jgi:oxygen-dependent protoporphyrinogen oxidase
VTAGKDRVERPESKRPERAETAGKDRAERPESKRPDLHLPDLHLSDLRLPDLHLSDLKLPDLKLPHLHLPHAPGQRRAADPALPHAVVVGGGMAGLTAAHDLLTAGYRVTVLEASSRFGGCVGSHQVAGLTLDSGAESFATRSTAVADLAAEVGLADQVTAPDPEGAWVQLPGSSVPLPRTGLLGIPADLDAEEVRAALGADGVARAAMDLQLPASVGTDAETSSVADLVLARMGPAVLERLVAPVVGGVHSADPAVLDVDLIAPGLRQAVRSLGSLSAAVREQRTASKAGSAVAGLRGGMYTLVQALEASLRERGAQLRTQAKVNGIRRTGDGWVVGAGKWQGEAQLLVVATDGPTAVRLLGGAVPELAAHEPQPGPDVRLVTLVVDLPELDVHPRGTGVLVAPQTPGIRAKALTHATAKWPWLASEAGPGTHVLRLSYGRSESVRPASPVRLEQPQQPNDQELLAMAMADATALLEQPIRAEDVLGWDVVRWQGTLPFAAVGSRARRTATREAARGVPGLVLTGGWLAGNGLAAVVADARSEVALRLSEAQQEGS